MFLTLNIILIILISEKYAYFTQDCEIIFLPTWNSTEAKEVRAFCTVLFYLSHIVQNIIRDLLSFFLIVMYLVVIIDAKSFRKIDAA